MLLKLQNAQEMQNGILAKKKEEFIEGRFNHQKRVIRECMEEGKHSCTWFASDKISYTVPILNEWSKELDGIFRPIFEDAGYTIEGSIIYW